MSGDLLLEGFLELIVVEVFVLEQMVGLFQFRAELGAEGL